MSGEAPEGWSVKPLGEIADLIMGQSPPSSAVAETGDGLPFIQGNAEFGARHPTPRFIASTTPKVVREGDILISVRAPVGEVNIAEGSLCIGRGVGGIRAKECDPDFLFYAVGGLSQTFARLSQGSTFDAINGKELRSIEILFPPLDEQRRIAEVLRSVDETTTATKASLRAMLLVRQVTLDDIIRSEASSSEDRPLELVAEVRTGLAKNAGRKGEKVSLPYLRVANVQDGWIDLTEVKTVEVDPAAVSRYSLQPGDVLLTEGGDYDKLGRGGIWTGDIEPCLHQNHVFAVRPDQTLLSSAFLALLTQSYLGRQYFLSCAKRTTNLASINSSQLKKLPVPAISLSRQQEIASEIGSLDGLIDIEKERVVALHRLRKAISHDLLSGRVRVPAPAPAASTAPAVQPAFKRAVFAAEVVHQLHNDDRFGSVKHEKIVHLCELHLRLQDDLDRHAYKEAAGPYDPSARRSVERIFRQQKWFDPTKQDKRIVYQPLEASGGHARYFDRYFGDRKAEVQDIIDLLRPLTTQQCEIIATLYAVWNDFLIDGRQPDDEEIVDGVLNNWTASKRQIPEEKWRAALPWMRQKKLIPTGHGEKTRVAAT